MIRYQIISTGSMGNAVVIEDKILIDCGVPFRALEKVYRGLQLVLLTHIHGDHFNRACIRRLARERPLVRFGCGRWLVEALIGCGVDAGRIDIFDFDRQYRYGFVTLEPVPLVHNVPNLGYKLSLPGIGRMIYATDTNNLNGIEAKGYDLYMIEANYCETEIKARMDEKKAAGEYAYEWQVVHNHLSREKADDWIYRNIAPNGRYIYMHQHQEREGD